MYKNTDVETTNTEIPRVKSANIGIIDAKIQQFFEEASSELKKKYEVMSSAATEMSRTLGVEVGIVDDASKLTGRQRAAKGWFDPNTGKVVVIPANHTSLTDLRATILHEVVGHKGLQEVFGQERFKQFIRDV